MFVCKVSWTTRSPKNSVIQACYSLSKGFIRDQNTKTCVCPEHEEIISGSCQCKAGFIRGTDGICVCPQYEHVSEDTCQCNDGFIRDASQQCVCPMYEELAGKFD